MKTLLEYISLIENAESLSSDQWIPFNGNRYKGFGEPNGVNPNDVVEVRFRNKKGTAQDLAKNVRWSWSRSYIGSTEDVLYYRIVKKAEEVPD